MDETRFDSWTRSFGTTGSRRAASRVLAGGAMAGLLVHVGLTPAAAKKKGKGKGKGKGKKKECGKGKKLCGSTCIPQGNCCNQPSSVCGDPCVNQLCEGGQCGCTGGRILHNGRCGFYRNCWSKGYAFGDDDPLGFNCCSLKHHIEGEGTGAPFYVCDAGEWNCLADIDCVSGPCRGFVCPELQVGCPGGPPI